MINNPWKSKEWKQKRDEIIKDAQCELCGSLTYLCVHHPQHLFETPYRVKQRMYNTFYTQFIELFNKKHKIEKIKTGRHRHKSHDYWHPAKTKHKTDIDESEIKIQYAKKQITTKEKEQFNKEYHEWRKSINAEEKINKELEKEREKYMSFENVQILCDKCHIAHHNGMNLCPVCKKKYKSMKYKTCWDCIPEERKKEIQDEKDKFEKWLREIEDFEDEDLEIDVCF